jgi:hypothetical protein
LQPNEKLILDDESLAESEEAYNHEGGEEVESERTKVIHGMEEKTIWPLQRVNSTGRHITVIVIITITVIFFFP